MSRPNKVNKDHYTQRGRLTADELARERARQVHLVSGQRRLNERTRKATERRDESASNPDRSGREEEE